MFNKIIGKLKNVDKKIFARNLLFVFSVTFIYSLSVNIPLIKMQYPEKYFLLAFTVSIFRDFIIWFIAFINRWVFAVFTFFTFVAGFGLKYMNKYLNMELSTGNFEIILATNFNEAQGVLNTILLTHLLAGLLVSLIFIYFRFKLGKENYYSRLSNKHGGGNYLHSYCL